MAGLPRTAAWLIRRVVSRDRADTVLADLETDYAAASGRGAARWWLMRETMSLLASYVTARFASARNAFPIWVRDVQLVMRGLRGGKVAALSASALLAVGLAAVLLSAGLAEALLFRSVSATHPDTLRRIVANDRTGGLVTRFSFLELEVVRQQLQGGAEIAAVYLQPVVLRAGNIDLQTMAEVVEGPYFGLTGTRLIIGRGLMTHDERADAPPVAVIAAPLWRRHFDASSGVLGLPIRLNGAHLYRDWSRRQPRIQHVSRRQR